MAVLAMYLRLSLEDGGVRQGKTDESGSIFGQRLLIREFVRQDAELKDYEAVEFCDDGHSGTDMDRPGMNRMLAEVKKNRIQCIIVKDLSRFSRDYIELGTYLNQIFPFMGVRFISIGDHYDSRNHDGSTIGLDTAFKTLLYDLYSKDLSVKVKAAFENKCANGEFIFGQAPFGYKKSREAECRVVVNAEEAAVVRRIFSLACMGKSSTEIARLLHEGGIPTAKQMRGIKPPENAGHGTWGSGAVRSILKNRFYLGEMSYGKSVREYVGSSRRKAVREKDWKVMPDHHEPLVTLEEFEKATCSSKGRSTKRKREKHPLVGKLACGGCGYAMMHKPPRSKNKYQRFECCRHSILKIPECCTYFRADMLEEIVLSMLNKELLLRGDATGQAESLGQFYKSAEAELEKRVRTLRLEKKQEEDSRDVLYEEYASGNMLPAEYRRKADEAAQKIGRLSAQIKSCEDEIVQSGEAREKIQADMKQIIRYSQMKELTQELADAFIRKIRVYKDKRVEIEWKFNDSL